MTRTKKTRKMLQPFFKIGINPSNFYEKETQEEVIVEYEQNELGEKGFDEIEEEQASSFGGIEGDVEKKRHLQKFNEFMRGSNCSGLVYFESFGVFHRGNDMHIKVKNEEKAESEQPEAGPAQKKSKTSHSEYSISIRGDGDQPEEGIELYDRVLVDAECTTDGSVRHIAKLARESWRVLESKFLRSERVDSIEALQRSLLRNGFRLLKPGGLLVYSTCSLTKKQNELVVEWFLAACPDAEIVSSPGLENLQIIPPGRKGGVEHTIRFDPILSGTSGLFVATFRKKQCT